MRRVMLVAAGLVWAGALTSGISALVAYAKTPGAVAHAAPAQWPSRTAVPRTAGRPVLLMFAHPHCPCSRASVGELARVIAQATAPKTTHVLFYKAAGTPPDWHRTALWLDAAAIPGVSASVDADGAEMRRFGVATSGHTLLYDAAGHLRFSGGITSSRGHAGDSAGRSTIVSLLTQRPAHRQTTSVFGCSLLEPPASTGASGR